MTNLEWLEKMKKEDEPYDYDECGWPTPEWRIKFRQTKALEIVAEELIDTNRLLRVYIINTGFKINDIQ